LDDKNLKGVKMTTEFQLSDQSIGAIMMALQKSLMEQSDIVPVLKGLRFRLSDSGLVVMNPPIVKFGDDLLADAEETDAEV
jgi:hypothetical protein